MDIIEKFLNKAKAEINIIKGLIENGSKILPNFEASKEKYDSIAEKIMIENYGENYMDVVEDDITVHTENAKLKEIAINQYACVEHDILSSNY